MSMETMSPLEWTLVVLGLAAAGLPLAGSARGLPFLTVIGRWSRWALFAFLFTYSVNVFDLANKSDWTLFATGLILWFCLETGYNWLAIKALNRSELPLFPTFRENQDGDEWPADTRSIRIREWLREQNYERIAALKATLVDDIALRASVYQSEDRSHRVQVLFIPKRKGDANVCFSFNSVGENGERLVTDNLFLPFGGYYPENWDVVRKPLIGSISRLQRLHRRRMERASFAIVPSEQDARDEINEQQRLLERVNLDYGFLVPPPEREEEGKLTEFGRYRLWKEMWLLAYFGKSVL